MQLMGLLMNSLITIELVLKKGGCMRRKFLLLIIVFALSLVFCDTVTAKEKKALKKEKTASTLKEKTDIPLVVQFDINTEKLPANEEVTDIVKLYSMLAEKLPFKKDEFETTDEYEKKKASAMSYISGNIYAFKIEKTGSAGSGIYIEPYNADLKQFEVSVSNNIVVKESSSTYSYIGENAYGAKRSVTATGGTKHEIIVRDNYLIEKLKITIPPDKAKTLKNNIGFLFICKPALRPYKPSYGHEGNDLLHTGSSYRAATMDNPYELIFNMKYINVEALAVWVYDSSTGEILLKTQLKGKDKKQVSYTDNGNGTIMDNVTGLIWQKEGDNTSRTWRMQKNTATRILSVDIQAGAYPQRMSL